MKYLKELESLLGRPATSNEIEAFTVMWSEHCGYSHTKYYIKRLPKTGKSGNAGVIDLDNEHFLAFKIESHNHPSAIEPYNGAATGVGGIIRDILAMGARPTALADSLHMHRITDGIIEGIADYGNSIGVPTIAGELRISDFYKYNPLVNVMAVGIGKKKNLIESKATYPGQVIVIYGGPTGRDGIHGASFASEDLTGDKATKLSIQVGDPFAEKLLIESFLEMVEAGLVEGAQDLGAGGVLSATSELVAKGNLGCIVHLDRVPLREPLKPIEILISESQERMAVVTSPEKAQKVLEIVKKHHLYGAIVGEVVEGDRYVAKYKDEIVLDVPAKLLEQSPEIEGLDYTPTPFRKFQKIEFKSVLAQDVFERYDYMVGTDTVLIPGFGSAVMRIKGTDFGYSVSVHSRADIGLQDPYWGAYITVLESVRKTLSVGGEPLAITDGINYGDPDVHPEGLSAMMKGLKDACEFSNVYVASGNASLYNTYGGEEIPPTLIIGMVGKVSDISNLKPKKSDVYLVGWEDFELEREKRLWNEIRRFRNQGMFVVSMSDYSNLETLKTALSRIGLELQLENEIMHEAIHQIILVFGNVLTELPSKKIGKIF